MGTVALPDDVQSYKPKHVVEIYIYIYIYVITLLLVLFLLNIKIECSYKHEGMTILSLRLC
jgi:hypothetical protein